MCRIAVAKAKDRLSILYARASTSEGGIDEGIEHVTQGSYLICSMSTFPSMRSLLTKERIEVVFPEAMALLVEAARDGVTFHCCFVPGEKAASLRFVRHRRFYLKLVLEVDIAVLLSLCCLCSSPIKLLAVLMS